MRESKRVCERERVREYVRENACVRESEVGT